MSYFRKKPVVIEAWQFTDAEKDRVFNTVRQFNFSVRPSFNPDGMPCLHIPTLEGEMRVDIDDWIIKGIKGELYPCKPDIFDATYEPVEAKDAT